MRALWLFLIGLFIVAWAVLHDDAVERTPGTLVAEAPVQDAVDDLPVIERDGYRLTRLARFSLEARVLSRRDYHSGREADLSPVDFALGWGPMSDSAVLDALEISQHDRFFFWRTKAFPIPRRDIETNASNMHLIPADDGVEAALDEVRAGHLVSLAGYLVEARAGDGWRWRSSLSRSDTGKGACELFYVESVSYR